MRIKWSPTAAPNSELIGAVMDAYIEWREESAEVTAAYRTWNNAPAHERALSHDNYVTALDREELAANVYMRLIEQAGGRATSP
jgi:hypothetical protein